MREKYWFYNAIGQQFTSIYWTNLSDISMFTHSRRVDFTFETGEVVCFDFDGHRRCKKWHISLVCLVRDNTTAIFAFPTLGSTYPIDRSHVILSYLHQLSEKIRVNGQDAIPFENFIHKYFPLSVVIKMEVQSHQTFHLSCCQSSEFDITAFQWPRMGNVLILLSCFSNAIAR